MGGDHSKYMNELRNDYEPPVVRPYKQTFGGQDEATGDELQNQDDKADIRASQSQRQAPQLAIPLAEERFTKEELIKIQKEFERLSKDDVIGKRKLLEYFRMIEIQDTYLSDEVFFMIKNSQAANSPIDYGKFINFVSIVAKGTREEKLSLLFTFFDKSVDSKITKDDLKAHISGTILSMQSVNFDIEDIERLKQSVAQAPENEIEQALDLMVQGIFQEYSGNQEELSYEEWKKWFCTLEGVEEVLQSSQKQSSFPIPRPH